MSEPTAIYNLFETAPYDVIYQGLEEREWKISLPNEVVEGVSLLDVLISRRNEIGDVNSYHIHTKMFPERSIEISKHEQLILKVLKAGADPWMDFKVEPNVFSKLLCLPFYQALEMILNHPSFDFEKQKNAKLLILDVDSQSSVNARTSDKTKHPLLHALSGIGNKEAIELLLKKGWKINELDSKGRTPLFFARNPEMVEFLVSKGVDVNHRSHMKNTAASVWTQRTFHTVAELQEMQKKLPNVKQKKGTATDHDLRGFIKMLLSANKTKAQSEARRLGVSFDQSFDNKSLLSHLALAQEAEALNALNSGNISYWSKLTKMIDSTHFWLNEQFRNKTENLTDWYFYFNLLNNQKFIFESNTPDEALENIKKAREIEPLFEGFFAQVKISNDKNKMKNQNRKLEQMIQNWCLSLFEQDSPSSWLTASSLGVLPVCELQKVMEEWFVKYQVPNAPLKFTGFGIHFNDMSRPCPLLVEISKTVKDRISDFSSPEMMTLLLNSYFDYESEPNRYNHPDDYNHFGLKKSNIVGQILTTLFENDAIWPVLSPLLSAKWDFFIKDRDFSKNIEIQNLENLRLKGILHKNLNTSTLKTPVIKHRL